MADGRSVVPGGLRELASSANDPAKRAPAMTPTRVYVIAEFVRRNAETGADECPCLVIRHADGSTEYTNRVEFDGPCELVYSREPLHDGSRVWIETTNPVRAA